MLQVSVVNHPFFPAPTRGGLFTHSLWRESFVLPEIQGNIQKLHHDTTHLSHGVPGYATIWNEKNLFWPEKNKATWVDRLIEQLEYTPARLHLVQKKAGLSSNHPCLGVFLPLVSGSDKQFDRFKVSVWWTVGCNSVICRRKNKRNSRNKYANDKRM